MTEQKQDDRLLPPHLVRQDLGGGREMRLAHPEEYPEVGRVLQEAFSTGCWVTPWYYEHLAYISERAESSHVWVVADPEGEVASIYRAVARKVAVTVAAKAKDFSSKFPTITVSKTT